MHALSSGSFDDWTYHACIYIRIIYTVNSTLMNLSRFLGIKVLNVYITSLRKKLANLWESDDVYI